MNLTDLTKRISDMSEEELLEHVRQIRHNREVARLGKQAHVKREVKRESRTASKSISLQLDKLTPEQRAALLAQLENGE